MRRHPGFLPFAIAAALALTSAAQAEPQLPAGFVDEPVVTGLHFSVCMDFLPDGRLFVTQHINSRILVVRPGPPPVVTVAGRVDSVTVSGERGVFGIAVDPRWPTFPYVYVHASYSGAPRIHLTRYRVFGDLDGTGDGLLTLDSLSRRNILVSLPDSFSIHNGGQVHFGPDSMLYMSLGDDGASCGSQARSRLLGKILRLDVRQVPPGPGPPSPLADITPADNPFVGDANPHSRLVWAYGLRNPYSFTPDPPTGHMVIADVGGAGEEEVDLATAPGRNFGWPLFEGYTPNLPCSNADTATTGTVAPLYTYVRPTNVEDPSVAVISGGRYRRSPGGPATFPPEYEGNIFFSDVYQGFLRRLVPDGAGWRLADSVAGQPSATDWGRDYDGVTSYAIGPDGALWYAKYAERYTSETGQIRRIRWTGPPAGVHPGAAPPRLAVPVPNPARHSVRFAGGVPEGGPATLDIHDVSGARVRRLQLPDSGMLEWDLRDDRGRRLVPGLYFVRLTWDQGPAQVQRLVILP